jgi:hypothetical protein
MPGLIPLLRAVAADTDRLDPDLFNDAAARWAIEVGLGPTLYRAVRNHPSHGRPREAFEWLQGSDLSGRVVVGEILDALEEILVSSDALAEQITLLKGASLSQFLYPEPHLRPMVDIDLLVTERARTQLESVLRQLGYRQRSSLPSEFYEAHHHGMPFVHGARSLCVEVHTALISRCAAARDRVFSSAHVSSRIEPAISRGHRTNRLSAELEIAYTCTHWALERGCLAGGVLPLVDVVHQVTQRGGELDWDRLLSDLDDSHAATHVRLALGYLERNAVIDCRPACLSADRGPEIPARTQRADPRPPARSLRHARPALRATGDRQQRPERVGCAARASLGVAEPRGPPLERQLPARESPALQPDLSAGSIDEGRPPEEPRLIAPHQREAARVLRPGREGRALASPRSQPPAFVRRARRSARDSRGAARSHARAARWRAPASATPIGRTPGSAGAEKSDFRKKISCKRAMSSTPQADRLPARAA